MASSTTISAVDGVKITAEIKPHFDEILTPDALKLVAKLQREFGPVRERLLRARAERQARFDAGEMPDFLPETKSVREADWKVAPIPADLSDRRVEITGPTDRKMVINALNSGAKCFMADFEDANSPTWTNLIEGHLDLRDANLRTIDFTSPEGKQYKLNDEIATLLVRPRGWHLDEKHVLVDGKPVAGGIFDFALYLFHNARTLMKRGSGPYFYLPKLQSHLEARMWNDIFNVAQDALDIPRGTIRATVLIETLPAAFEADEILYELRDHSSGLNCGRWDYIFSFIKTFRNRPEFVLPDRNLVTMTVPFMRAYCLHVIKTCHRRGIHAMGGMAAQIPIKGDPSANETALAKVRADKEREATDGHDGTWVAHPGLVPVALEVFDKYMPTPNQIDRQRDDVHVTAADLVKTPPVEITEHGLRWNINVGVSYLEAWLRGNGCVPLYNLMEDAATSEICRTQCWQWIRHDAGRLEDGRNIDVPMFRAMLAEELKTLKAGASAGNRFDDAAKIFDQLTTADTLVEFLTLPAYAYLE